MVADRHGRVVVGNKVVAAARALNLPITVVRTAGDQLVVVQRADLDLTTDAKARRLGVADNRVGQLSLQWDPELLKTFAEEGVRLEPFWTPDEFEQLLGRGLNDGQGDANATVQPPTTDIVRGQLFALGAHRLLCGDASDAADALTAWI